MLSLTHAGVEFRSATAIYGVLYWTATSYLPPTVNLFRMLLVSML